ncbi:isomerase [Candidatus Poribacteria bacterium]|nr:isomerase [Candidatus Poribacteria bacterium]
MKFGMNLLLWSGNIGEEHYPILENLKAMGYDGVEVPLFEYDVNHCAKLGKQLDELGLERTAVTVRNAEDNPISPSAPIRANGVALNKQALDCCQALGTTFLCGPYHSALGEFSGTGPTDEEKAWGIESMQLVAEHAQVCGVTLAVEYLNRFECYFLTSAVDAANFIDAVNHPNCRMMYDTFHANIEEKSVAEAIRVCQQQTVHVHISENDRSTPGNGLVRWDETFNTLKETGYDGWMVVEAFGLALPELVAATKIWRRMYESEEQLAKDALKFMKSEWTKRG